MRANHCVDWHLTAYILASKFGTSKVQSPGVVQMLRSIELKDPDTQGPETQGSKDQVTQGPGTWDQGPGTQGMRDQAHMDLTSTRNAVPISMPNIET